MLSSRLPCFKPCWWTPLEGGTASGTLIYNRSSRRTWAIGTSLLLDIRWIAFSLTKIHSNPTVVNSYETLGRLRRGLDKGYNILSAVDLFAYCLRMRTKAKLDANWPDIRLINISAKILCDVYLTLSSSQTIWNNIASVLSVLNRIWFIVSNS